MMIDDAGDSISNVVTSRIEVATYANDYGGETISVYANERV